MRIDNNAIRELAREQYSSEVNLEIDRDAEIRIGPGAEVWVQAWVQVDVDELGDLRLYAPRPPQPRSVIDDLEALARATPPVYRG